VPELLRRTVTGQSMAAATPGLAHENNPYKGIVNGYWVFEEIGKRI